MKAKAATKMTQSGSLALTFCLLLPVVFLFLLTLFDNALKDRRDLDLSRWVAANLELNLANFDQELWQSFGLFALNKPLGSIPSANYDNTASIQVTGMQTLFENKLLSEQILSHMKLRFPAEMIREISHRISQVQIIDDNSLMGSLDELFSEDGYAEAQDYLITKPPADPEWEEELDEYLEEEIAPLYNKIASALMPVHIYDQKGDITTGKKPDFFDPESMSRLASVFDSILAVPSTTALDKLYIAGYALDYFPAAVSSRIRSQQTIHRYTPDGRSHGDLIRSRPYELEEILTGRQGKRAADEIKSKLVVLRSLIQLAHHAKDKALRFTYRLAARGFVAGIAVISLGTIILPPEPFEYLMLIARAVADGSRDVNRLRSGYGVPFWPEERSSVTLYYHDYLLLFMLVQSEEEILSRMGAIIQRHHPGPGWVKLKAETVTEQGKTFSLEGGYQATDSR